MNICVQCKRETNSDFEAKELKGILCPKCMKMYIGLKKGEINSKIKDCEYKIEQLENKKKNYDYLIIQAKIADCKHENKTSTGMLIPRNGKMFKEYICDDCKTPVLEEKEM